MGRRLVHVIFGLIIFSATPAMSEVSIPEEVIAVATEGKECRLPAGKSAADMTQVGQLDSDRTLYLVPCPSDANNVLYQAIVGQAAGDMGEGPMVYELKHFANFSQSNGWHAVSYLANATFDEEAARLVHFYKETAAASCGTRTSWVWTEYGFVMEELRQELVCNGLAPMEWPAVYEHSAPLPGQN